MPETVNNIYQSSLEWLPSITWIRVNMGFMRSEIEELKKEPTEETAGIAKVLGLFDDALTEFAKQEMLLFVEARTSERSPLPWALSELHHPLFAMSTAFDECRKAFIAEVERLRITLEGSSTLALCHCCGAEIYKSHQEVCEAVSRLIQVIDANLN
jgi:hypothetical protein